MKKIFLLLLPILVVLAMVFTIRNKNISWITFIQFIKDLRFDSALNSINTAITDLKGSVDSFSKIGTGGGILAVLKNIGTGLSNFFVGSFHLVKALLDLVIDIGNNLFAVTDFLFGVSTENVGMDLNPYGS